MRVFALILLIPLTAVLAAGLWGLAIMKGDVDALVALVESGELPSAPTFSGVGAGGGGSFDLLVANHMGTATLGPGDSEDGLTIERADETGAVALLPTGQRVTLTPTDGYAPMNLFARPNSGHLGALLLHEEATPLGLVITDIEAMRTAKLPEKMEFYAALAREIEARDPVTVQYDDVRHDARGVFYCLRARWDDVSVLAGARIDRGLLIVAVLREGCGEADDTDMARLEIGVRAVSPERWR